MFLPYSTESSLCKDLIHFKGKKISVNISASVYTNKMQPLIQKQQGLLPNKSVFFNRIVFEYELRTNSIPQHKKARNILYYIEHSGD